MEFLSLETSTLEKTEISQLILLVYPDGVLKTIDFQSTFLVQPSIGCDVSCLASKFNQMGTSCLTIKSNSEVALVAAFCCKHFEVFEFVT